MNVYKSHFMFFFSRVAVICTTIRLFKQQQDLTPGIKFKLDEANLFFHNLKNVKVYFSLISNATCQ